MCAEPLPGQLLKGQSTQKMKFHPFLFLLGTMLVEALVIFSLFQLSGIGKEFRVMSSQWKPSVKTKTK